MIINRKTVEKEAHFIAKKSQTNSNFKRDYFAERFLIVLLIDGTT